MAEMSLQGSQTPTNPPPAPYPPVCLQVPPGHQLPARQQGRGLGQAASLSPWSGQKGGCGVTHLLAFDASQPREDCFVLLISTCGHTHSHSSMGMGAQWGWGSQPHALTSDPSSLSRPSGGSRSSAARTRVSQDRQESPCERHGGLWDCLWGRSKGQRDGGQQDEHSPSPL